MAFIDASISLIKKAAAGLINTLDKMEDEKAISALCGGLIQIFNSTRGEGLGYRQFLERSKRLLRLLREATLKVEAHLDKEAADTRGEGAKP